ncbi:hypothetical protein Bca52824_030742 [Brassica carinata]|uniref:Phytanoyl-CoA dioxygenase n=1 Tax=Brassica carinata TaxID=52824 RepID=A0A8X7V713_BRACI|nr:hypothetical protein Bca52824_030742 [Brassica carinata]
MALEDSTTLNGLVRRFVRGENGVTYDQSSPSYEQEDFLANEMKAGSMIAIHGDLIHQSFENQSPKLRHAYSLRVVESDGCKWVEDNWIRRENMPEPLYAP